MYFDNAGPSWNSATELTKTPCEYMIFIYQNRKELSTNTVRISVGGIFPSLSLQNLAMQCHHSSESVHGSHAHGNVVTIMSTYIIIGCEACISGEHVPTKGGPGRMGLHGLSWRCLDTPPSWSSDQAGLGTARCGTRSLVSLHSPFKSKACRCLFSIFRLAGVYWVSMTSCMISPSLLTSICRVHYVGCSWQRWDP